MNTDDSFEQRLCRQPVRPVPPEWRGEILTAASRVAGVELTAAPGGDLARFWTGVLRRLLWPSPAAWAGLAAIWVIAAALNLAAATGQAEHARPGPAQAQQFWQMLKAQRQMLAELDDATGASQSPPPAGPYTRPHTRGGTTTLNS